MVSEKSYQLTIYLVKNKETPDENILKNSESLVLHSLKIDGAISANLYVCQPTPNYPGWSDFFSDKVNRQVFGKGSSTGAVLIMRLKKATFIISFGRGRFQIEDRIIVRDFGLKVALNSIVSDQLRSVDKSSHDKTPLSSRTQSSKGVNIVDLAIDKEFDLLTAISGSTVMEVLGTQVTGRDALSIKKKILIDDLSSLISEIYEVYLKEDYKKNYEWVDNLRDVKDEAMVFALDNELVKFLNSTTVFDNCWLAEPEIIDWEVVSFYCFERKGKKTQYFPELRLNVFLDTVRTSLGKKSIVAEDLRTQAVHAVNDNYDIQKSWSAYNCLYAEIEYKKSTYLLQNGKWYKVNDDFVDRVNKAIANIKTYSPKLPAYEHAGEGAYNEHLCKSNSAYVLMDKNNIVHGGGNSKIEFCDVIKDGVDFIHVKRGTSSSNLSHLFSQGYVSAEIFSGDIEFRKKVNKKLPNGSKIHDVSKRPDASKYKIVYAIVSEQNGPLKLPFFSKVKLKNISKSLDLLGYQIALAKIEVSDQHKKKSRYKAS